MRARTGTAALVAALALAGLACAPVENRMVAPMVTWQEVVDRPVPPADARIAYGSAPLQFGELRLPDGPGPHPVVVVVHGGCWESAYDLAHAGSLSEALTRTGAATWTLEYRRIGDPGGGWPGTFEDVARGTDHVRTLAARYPLDTTRVVVAGHSAGGHLALWLAARARLPAGSPLAATHPLPLRGVVALGAITDLRAYGAEAGDCNASVARLLGGGPDAFPDRYAAASPADHLPLGVPVRLVHGAEDAIVPVAMSEAFAAQARARGDDARVHRLEGAGHFDVIAPWSPAWPAVEAAVRALLGRP
jgi:acetyl esterase/lipase